MKINQLTESLNRKYMMEDASNDEVNKVIRRNRKKGYQSIPDEDKEFLRQNGIEVKRDPASSHSNARPFFQGKGRHLKADTSYDGGAFGGASGDHRSYPDFSNRKFDVKGWLDTDRTGNVSDYDIDKSLRPYSDMAKGQLNNAKDMEARGRRNRVESEAEIANRLEDGDVYGAHNSRWHGEYNDRFLSGDWDYEQARYKRDSVSNIAKEKKEEHGVYESLNESVDGPGVNLMYGIIDLLGEGEVLRGILRYLPDGEIQDLSQYFIDDYDIPTEAI